MRDRASTAILPSILQDNVFPTAVPEGRERTIAKQTVEIVLVPLLDTVAREILTLGILKE